MRLHAAVSRFRHDILAMRPEISCTFCRVVRPHVIEAYRSGYVKGAPHSLEIYVDILRCVECQHLVARYHERARTPGSTEYVDWSARLPTLKAREQPSWVEGYEHSARLTPPIRALLCQVYEAYNAGWLALAAMGTRSVWERIMIDACGDRGSFPANLKAFEGSGAITGKQRDALETVLELGHATTHRAFVPTRKDLDLVLDVTEALLQPPGYDAISVNALRSRIPPRKP